MFYVAVFELSDGSAVLEKIDLRRENVILKTKKHFAINNSTLRSVPASSKSISGTFQQQRSISRVAKRTRSIFSLLESDFDHYWLRSVLLKAIY